MHDEAFKAQKLQVQDKAVEHYHASSKYISIMNDTGERCLYC